MAESKKYNIHLVIIGNGTFVLHVLLLSTKGTFLYFFVIPNYYTEDQDFSSAPPPSLVRQ